MSNVVFFVDAANSTGHEFRVGVLSSVVASALTYTAVVLLRFRLPTISHLVFWRRFAQDLVVLISEIEEQVDPQMRPGHQPPLTPIGDAVAMGDFLRFFRRRLRSDPTVVSAQSAEAFSQVKHRNLLVIGGAKYNYAARTLLRQLDPQLVYQFRRLRPYVPPPYKPDDPELKYFVKDEQGPPAWPKTPSIERDYGCVVMAPNPYNEQRRVLIVAGLTTLGTMAASEWLQRVQPTFWFANRKRGFEAIVEFRPSGITRVSHVKHVFRGPLLPEQGGDA